MTTPQLPSGPPVTTIEEVIDRMEAIEAALPPTDGLACFNRMYLGVTQQVLASVKQTMFADPEFLVHLDVLFANLYFDAVNAVTLDPENIPIAWRPLMKRRTHAGIEPIQFALAGMNAHINHDLPIALFSTCTNLETEPKDDPHHRDYSKVDVLLDAAEQSVRQSFEAGIVLKIDKHAQACTNVVANWSMNAAREMAWDTALGLWETRTMDIAHKMMLLMLGRTVALASRGLLVVV
ncbi:MAG: hypothetical protein QOG44_3806 [Acidimicrobiaceae bacterium]|nr:hypothetical protein [Acidimicrobiaceae bacterium]